MLFSQSYLFGFILVREKGSNSVKVERKEIPTVHLGR